MGAGVLTIRSTGRSLIARAGYLNVRAHTERDSMRGSSESDIWPKGAGSQVGNRRIGLTSGGTSIRANVRRFSDQGRIPPSGAYVVRPDFVLLGPEHSPRSCAVERYVVDEVHWYWLLR